MINGQRPRPAFYVITFAFVALVFLVSLETFSRFFLSPWRFGVPFSDEFVYDAKVGWRGTAGLAGKEKHGRYPVPIAFSINADGFRDDDWDEKLRRAAETGARKILVLGDSLLYGWASEKDGRLTEQLAERYGRNGLSVEIFNAGIPGYGASQQRRLLPELLERIEPDIVVLLFSSNDYGDTALPYDHRYPIRIYKPYYDVDGKLVLNETVPRRPSLVMRDTILGDLDLWYAFDLVYYFLQDFSYGKYDVPTWKTSPVPIYRLDSFIWLPKLKSRFPQVERTVMRLYADMAALSKQQGVSKFVVTFPGARPAKIVEPKLDELSIAYISPPEEIERYFHWSRSYRDGHPNFLWAWLLSGRLFGELEDRAAPIDFARMPQFESIPTFLDLSSDEAAARYIFGTWAPPHEHGRWLRHGGRHWTGHNGTFMLRVPDPLAPAVTLAITANGKEEVALKLVDENEDLLCQLNIDRSRRRHQCEIETGGRPILFVKFLPASGEDPEVPVKLAFVERAELISGP